ncbi:hypothetical protein OIV83_005978 [Microbotryomycetes sp. JL201]|nr:hypothetical protein OIV83_005978 [Microbotryomycetes sp. JL201]
MAAAAVAQVGRAAHAVHDILWQPVHRGALGLVHAARDALGAPLGNAQGDANAIAPHGTATASAAARMHRNPTIESPSALSFLTSSFFCGIVALSVISNRIQAVVPPRRALHQAPSPTVCRFLRLPSLLLLLRVVMLLTVTILVARGYDPVAWPLLGPVARVTTWSTTWAGKSSLQKLFDNDVISVNADQICWEVFLAVGLAAITENFMRALLDDLSAPEFNLLGFSFLLHVGSAISHNDKHDDVPQPIDLYLHLLIVTAEMLHLHLSFALTPPLPPLRLAISGFWSVMSQIVAVRGLVRLWRGDDLDGRVAWQSMLWSASVPQMTMEAMAALTITLRLITAILRKEEVSVPSVFGHEAHFPRASDDFAIAVVRYGGACLAQTRLAGLANEVSPLRILAPAPLALVGLQLPPVSDSDRNVGPYVQLGRGSDLHIKWTESPDGRVPLCGGLETEIKRVETVERSGGGPSNTRERRQGREVWNVVRLVLKMAFYIVYRSHQLVRQRYRLLKRAVGLSSDEQVLNDDWRTNEDAEEDDDKDWEPLRQDYSDNESDVGSDDESEAETDSYDDHPTLLLRDLRDGDSDALTPVLVAHHLSGSAMTRRQYRMLATAPGSSVALSSAVEERQIELRNRARERGLQEGWEQEQRRAIDESRQRFCVVCAVEERTIVLWPCRCLTLCDDCRSNLAERTPASQHLCPTCRAPVKGFSKLFIP